jgi:malonate-semialdehyde dehydrogenase (acetylating)/methylmalonate-semialdehyde dehydrogenase
LNHLHTILNSRSGPVISPASVNKIESLIASCEEEGGKILLDGRNYKVANYPHGNWIGPTVLEAKEGFKCHEYVVKLNSITHETR